MQGTDVLIIGTACDSIHFGNLVVPKDTLNEVFVARILSTGQYNTCKIARHHLYKKYDWCQAEEIKTDQSGKIYALAWFKGTFVWDKDTIVAPYGQYLLQFSNNLQYQDTSLLSNYYSRVASDITFNSLDEIYYIWSEQGKYNFDAAVRKKNTITSPHISHYWQSERISAIDLDSCNNVYFVGWGDNSWPGPYVPKFWTHVGMLSPGGNLNWLRTDSSDTPLLLTDVVCIGLNKVYTAMHHHGNVTLVNSYTPTVNNIGYLHAILQATFGVPSIVTPQPLQTCDGKPMVLTCTSGGVIHWYNSPNSNNVLAIGSNYTITSPVGTYTYYAEARTCTIVSGRIPVVYNVLNIPIFTINDGTTCSGSPFVLQAPPGLSYSYSSGSATVTPIVTSQYTVEGMDQNECVAYSYPSVYALPLPALYVQPLQNSVCKGSTVTLMLSGALQYSISSTPVTNTYTFVPVSQTTLSFSGTDENSCTATVSYIHKVNECVDINENATDQHFTFYPNPSEGILNITASAEGKIQVTNCIGQVVYTVQRGAKQTLDLRHLPDGIYFLQQEGSPQDVQKFIIKR